LGRGGKLSFLAALVGELALIALVGRSECLLEYQLADAHSNSKPDRDLPVIDHFQSNLARKASVDRRGSYVNTETEPSQRTFSLHPRSDAIVRS
jgi:hypothetical protein